MNRHDASTLLTLALVACAAPPREAAPAPAALPPEPLATASAPSAASAAAAPLPPSTEPADAGARPPAEEEPPVEVKVVTIGMHVGGGPFDEPTKEPFRRSVEPHFPELARCFRHVAPPRKVDVGVDLLVQGAGGKARVSNPRASIDDASELKTCVVAVFETIDFERPKFGRTGVSYSLRFSPR